jgi:catechol 2,3-dioxygenase-like lactoylglutathione lyase family enzyme
MFSHIMIGTNDLEKAKSFYDALLGTLGVPPGRVDRHRIFYRTPTGVFSVSKPIDGEPATPANGGTVGFVASSAEHADAGMRRASPTAGRPAKTRRVYAKWQRANSISPICEILTATSSAPCIGWNDQRCAPSGPRGLRRRSNH